MLFIFVIWFIQLLDGLDVLQRNTLTPLKQEFIARNLIGTYRNLTAGDFIRLVTAAQRHRQPFCFFFTGCYLDKI